VEVDLDAVAGNVEYLGRIAGQGVAMMAIVKANAYGHGDVPVARVALECGASTCGVATLNEALRLREAGIREPILLLGYASPSEADTIVANDLRATVFSMDVALALSQAASSLHSHVQVHVKVDTGMSRLGLAPGDARDFIRSLMALPGINVEGISTHLAAADSPHARQTPDWGVEYTRKQLESFQGIVGELADAGIEVPYVHAANSAALLAYPESRFTMVRPGIALYGLHPSPDITCPHGVRPALTFKTRVTQIRDLPAGAYVSYGCTFRVDDPCRVAVLSVGYADGFRRAPTNWGSVLVRGNSVPLVGRVCMDQCMADVSNVPGVQVGDEVVLIGAQGSQRLSAEDVAQRLGTINYEVTTSIAARVPRFHLSSAPS
jgi:alanine racemase